MPATAAVVYQEGIYSGYRYTETRYEDKILGTAGVGDNKTLIAVFNDISLFTVRIIGRKFAPCNGEINRLVRAAFRNKIRG